MDNVKRCTRCILPATLDSITFDNQGVCNYCRKYENDFREWDLIKERKEKEFESILTKAKSLLRPYDCLVPLSGGKDSTYALYLCSKVYGLKTLAVTFDNGYLTNSAKTNIKNALNSCSADHIFYTLNRKNSSELFRHFILQTGDFCNACMRGINYSIDCASRNFKIPLIIRGSGRRVQYVSQIKEVSRLNTASYFSNVLKNTDLKEKFKYLASGKHRLERQKILGGITDIIGLRRTLMMKYIPQHIGMYDYIYKPFPEILEIIKQEMNWREYKDSIEHLDCELHDVPFYKDTLRIPNIAKNTFYYSGLIRQGLMNRTEALEKESKEISSINPPKELISFLDTNKIDFGQYKEIVINTDQSKYEPRLQKISREIYHKFRKY